MPTFTLLKNRSNVNVAMSNHLFQNSSNITKNDNKPRKGIVTRNSHMKYLSLSTYYSKVIAKVKVFNMQVKHKGQGHKVKFVGTQGMILSQETLVWNIKVLVHTFQKI
jgi:hypothetical protein